MQGKKILVTGPAGHLTVPIVRELVKANEVWGLARFSDPQKQRTLESIGVRCVRKDIARDPLDDLPRDFDAVFHAGAMVAMDSERDMAYTFEVNVKGTGRLLEHCAGVKTFVHCSTASVYAYQPRPVAETDNYGSPIPAYSLSKIAAEQLVNYLATKHRIPTIILRIGTVYGPDATGPMVRIHRMLKGKEVWVNPVEPRRAALLYVDDAVRLAIRAMECGQVPPVTVNFCGNDAASIDEYCTYAGKLLGIEPKFKWTADTYPQTTLDGTKMHRILGKPEIGWKEGFRRLLAAAFPERKLNDDA